MPSPSPNPFVGPRPFEAGETLYGRKREIAELGDRLFSERIVLLHSPSGAGKSSLVRAGLLPELRRSFDVWGPTRVNQEPAKGVLTRAGVNRYVMSAVEGFEEEIPERGRRSADVLAGQTLVEYFTGRPRRRKAAPNVLLIFDQFEEVLTVDALAVEAKEAFFDQLGEVLRIPRAFALFVLREDYLAPLDPYSRRVPTHLRNRFRIDLLGLDAARQAMVEPARTGGREFPAVDQLVHDLATRKVQRLDGSFEDQTGRHVEPVQLQVTCRRLWDAMPDDDLSIDPGDVTEALGGYYADSVAEVADDTATERAVREWFEHRLITDGGIRGQVLREAGESGGLANDLIEALRGTHLIRAEQRAGTAWYELAHDRLVEPVRANNKTWRDEHLSAVQQRATLWERQKRPLGLLMKDEELAEGEAWAAGDEVGLTDVERRFLAASREAQDAVEKERRQARRIRMLAVVSLIVAVLAAWQWWEANGAKNDAVEQREAAEVAKEEAEKQKRTAISQAEIATSGRLAATVAATTDVVVASLLANESWTFADNLEAKRTLLTALLRSPQWKATIHPPSPVYGVAFSLDGKTLATASFDKTVWLWDVATRQPLGAPLTGHKESVYGVAFSPDGKTLASASINNKVWLWDVATRQPLGEPLIGHEGPVHGVAFSPDGQTLASASEDNKVRLWDVATRQPLGEPLIGHRRDVVGVAFSPDGKTLASASVDNWVRLWDVATGQPLGESLIDHEGYMFGIAFSPDGQTLASGDANGEVRLWDVATGQPLGAPLTGHEAGVYGVAFSPDGQTLASASFDKMVRLWDVATHQPLGESLIDHEGCVLGVAFSPDGQTLVAASLGGAVGLWDAVTGQLPGALTGHEADVCGVAFSPDGQTLVSGDANGEVRLWDVATGDPFGEALTGHEADVYGVAFSPDGQTLASGDANGEIRLWDIATGQPLGGPLTGHDGDVYGVAFSPDGQTLASASGDATVRLWDVATGDWLGEALKGHEEGVIGVAFSPDGQTLASASNDKTVRLWDVATHQSLGAPLIGHQEGVIGVSFSPDGRTLASASRDKTVRLWDVDPDSWLTRTCARAGRNLSLTEWQQYVGLDFPYRRTCPEFPPGEGVEASSVGEPP